MLQIILLPQTIVLFWVNELSKINCSFNSGKSMLMNYTKSYEMGQNLHDY